MLQSIKQLYGYKLGTPEGEIGHVKDFYFDDRQWAVRYVVADTGAWLSERLVLISPHAFGNFCQDGESLLVNLSRQQIENCPSAEAHRPVSRQYEEEYYRYYGWPSYWEGGEMWGMAGFPVAPPPHLIPVKQSGPHSHARKVDEPHLQSTRAVTGYDIQTGEGKIGHVTDFLMDSKSWVIRHLVVETGHWYSEKEIVISPKQIERISYENSKVFVNITKEAIQDAAQYLIPHAISQDADNFAV